jgi:hypothetical protein
MHSTTHGVVPIRGSHAVQPALGPTTPCANARGGGPLVPMQGEGRAGGGEVKGSGDRRETYTKTFWLPSSHRRGADPGQIDRVGWGGEGVPGCQAASPCGTTRNPHKVSGDPGGCPCGGGGSGERTPTRSDPPVLRVRRNTRVHTPATWGWRSFYGSIADGSSG